MIAEAPQIFHPVMSGEVDLDSAFDAIFRAHYPRVYSLLIQLVGERSLAEDLATDVFCKLHSQPAAAPVWKNTAAWLYRTATNAGIDALRAEARRKRYETAASHLGAFASNDGGPLDSVLRAEQCLQVRAVLRAMKPAQAQILLMRAGGSSYKELAEVLQVAASGVGTLVNRAEAEFRKRYLKLTRQKEAL